MQHDNFDASRPLPDDTLRPSIDMPQRLFTMTVEDVASQLHQHGVDRDSRTIQRWCKSGKLKAVLDTSNGERWLIESESALQVIGDIVAELSRRSQYVPTPKPSPSPVQNDMTRHHAERAMRRENSNETQADIGHGTARAPGHAADKEATPSRRVAELELENATLRADVQVREQMNTYMQKQFEEMMNTALDKAQRLGQLEAEVDYLKKALPPADQMDFGFHPRNVQAERALEDQQTSEEGV